MGRLYTRMAFVVFLCCLALFVGVGTAAGAQQDNTTPADTDEVTTTDAFNRFDVTIDRPPIAGTKSTVGAEVEIPGLDFIDITEGTLTFKLAVEGIQVDSDTTLVSPGETASISLSHTFPEQGEYDITVSGEVTFEGPLDTRTFSGEIPRTVTAIDPSLDFTEQTLLNSQPVVNKNTNIDTIVDIPDIPRPEITQNRINVDLFIDGQSVDNINRQTTEGANEPASFTHAFKSNGEHNVTVVASISFPNVGVELSESITRTVSVLDPSLDLDRISSESPLKVGEQVGFETNLSLAEIPSRVGQRNADLDLLINGTGVTTSSIPVSGNGSVPVSLAHSFDSAGVYNVTITGSVTFPNIDITLSRSISRVVTVADTDIGLGDVQFEDREISANFSVPDIPQIDVSGRAQATLFIDGDVRTTQEVDISDGEQSTLRLTYAQPAAGTRNVTIKLNGSVQEYDFSGSVTTELSIGESISGVTFAVPKSLEDKTEGLLDQIDALPSNASVLVSESGFYFVFASADLRTGNATVNGVVLDQQRSQGGFSFGVVLASNVTYADPLTATVNEIRNDPGSYRLKSVQVTDTYRRVSALIDPDTVPLTVAQTAGVMGGPADPLTGNIGARVARLVANASNKTDESYSEEIESLLQRTGQSRLPTTGLTSGFWASAQTQVTGLVIAPGSRARDYLQTFGPENNSYDTGGLPLLYRTAESFEPTQVDNISSLSQRADALAGDVVSVEAKFFQERLSVQETLEHGTPCTTNLLQIPTPQGPVCVNVPVDVLLHGGVAWNGVPTSRDDVLFVVGASSRSQDKPLETKDGVYEIVGTLRDTSEVSGLLPDGKILVAHDFKRTGSFTPGEDARELALNRTREILGTLRNQVNSTVSELRSRLPVDVRDIVAEELQDQRQVSASLDIPDILPGRDVSKTVQTRLVVDGESVATKQVTVTDGETARLNLTYTPQTTLGNTATLWINGSVAGRNISTSVTVEFDIGEQFSGTSFALPESLKDEVNQFRKQLQIPGRVPSNVSVLANDSDIHLVFSNTTPETGRANLTGVALDTTLNSRNLTFGVILARNATYNTTGRPVSVSEVASNPAEYQRDLVRVNATHRHAALLADPDTGTEPTVAGTAGVLAESPQGPRELLDGILSTARTVALNGSVSQFGDSLNGTLTGVLGEQSPSRLPTASLQTDFWTDAPATVDAVVLTTSSAARAFVERFDPTDSSMRAEGSPLLYRTQSSFESIPLSSIRDLQSSSDLLNGKVVSVTANFSQQRISVQETLEHSANEACSTDRLPVETPEGTACVNIPIDTLVHGGVAWTTTVPGQEDIIPVVGVSSLEQDTPQKRLVGEYQIVGEVVTASRLNASWPDEPLLVAYDLTRRDGLDLRNETQGIITDRAEEVIERVQEAVNGTGNSLAPPQRTEINGTVTTDQSSATNAAVIAVNASVGTSLNRPADELANLVSMPNVFATTTTVNGEFQLAVPDGQYRLVAFNSTTDTVSTIRNVPAMSTGVEMTLSPTLDRGLPPIASDTAPEDLDNDGLYEDVRGEGSLNILDVQALFNNLDNPDLQNDAEAFKFQENGASEEVTILDVQALFNELQE